MEFSELKKAIQKGGLVVQETDFIKDSDESLNLGYMEMNSTQKLIFSISTFKGKKYFSVRTWFQAESGEWAPTKKGVNLSFEKFAEFEKLVQVFGQAIQLDK